MAGALGFLWRHHRIALLSFSAVLVLTVFFGVRAVLFGVYWSDPAHRDQSIQGWMTPRYIAQSWSVPPEIVGAALGLPPDPGKRIRLEDLAAEQGVPLPVLAAQVEAAIAAFRATDPSQP